MAEGKKDCKIGWFCSCDKHQKDNSFALTVNINNVQTKPSQIMIQVEVEDHIVTHKSYQLSHDLEGCLE